MSDCFWHFLSVTPFVADGRIKGKRRNRGGANARDETNDERDRPRRAQGIVNPCKLYFLAQGMLDCRIRS